LINRGRVAGERDHGIRRARLGRLLPASPSRECEARQNREGQYSA
jgi:hypothetical protein